MTNNKQILNHLAFKFIDNCGKYKAIKCHR